jgi:hypothetical protein
MFNFLYLVESGSPSMTTRGLRNQRWLTLGGFFMPGECWGQLDAAVTKLKEDWLADYVDEPTEVELHSSDFGSKSPWREIYADGKWQDFLMAIGAMVESLPVTTPSATIDKQSHFAKYTSPMDPYELAYNFVIERFDMALRPDNCGAVVLDPRSEGKGADDQRMRVVHRELRNATATIVEDVFFAPSAISAGVQVADVCAWAVRKHHQAAVGVGRETPIYAGVEARYRRSGSGRIRGYGEKLFP